jgi:hypothetical protein
MGIQMHFALNAHCYTSVVQESQKQSSRYCHSSQYPGMQQQGLQSDTKENFFISYSSGMTRVGKLFPSPYLHMIAGIGSSKWCATYIPNHHSCLSVGQIGVIIKMVHGPGPHDASSISNIIISSSW